MATMTELFALAQQYHQGGQLPQAEKLYRQILLSDPRHAGAHHYLGLLAHQTGHAGAAVALMRQAITLNPAVAFYHANLGVVLQAAGQMEEALACFTQALELDPDLVDAHNNRGNLLQHQGRLEEAVASYRQALRLDPTSATAYYNLSNALRDQRQLNEAVATYRQALQINPNYVEAHNNLGVVLKDLGRLDEAAACYREALRLNPRHVDAHKNLGNVFGKQRQLDEAIACYRQALSINPADASAHYNLGIALKEQGQMDQAIGSYRWALAHNPGHVDAHNNLGIALKEQGRLEEAIASYRQALRLDPNHVNAHVNLANAFGELGRLDEAAACLEQALRLNPQDAVPHYNRALLWLLTGNFQNGWPEYEYGWKEPVNFPRRLVQPRWDGSALQGKTILLYAEQGLGDTLQFIRYAARIKQRGGTVLFECPSVLLQLFERVAGVDRILPQGQPLPGFDVQAPLLSLPGLFGTTLDTIPAQVPYLYADPERARRWRKELQTREGFRVGIVWQGSLVHKGDRQRSVPLGQFAPLARVQGVRLFSLQVGAGTDQLAQAGERLGVIDLGSRFDPHSLEDVTAVLPNLDLVVTVDTALAHLAGALAVPVWVALPFAPDWRWLLGRSDSPWYPTMRLFRQPRPGDWAEVFERIAAELGNVSASRTGR